ncbi:hypothetical protein GCM10010401_15830 [Rarobacter faecitabidus]|uniref:Uncharacterized protein n=1 Tax=Rarobacter faecitabidus TaxID=13243 RepID=A0A542ZXE6_RARFA|nr:hypothetical protein [Rarobacter faecitabidus]TQL65015.1 hypothetical protein FB461_1548 [Rarobacter faecitabidus]
MNTKNGPFKTGPNANSIVWGILIILAGGLLLAWGIGVGFNTKAVLAIALGVAGVLLLIAAVVPAVRRSRDDDHATRSERDQNEGVVSSNDPEETTPTLLL